MHRDVLAAMLGGALVFLAAFAGPAAAESTNAAPIIHMGSAETDPAKLPLLDDAGRKSLATVIGELKSGKISSFVFSVTPDGRGYQPTMAGKGVFESLSDLARQSLEGCEYPWYRRCIILSINGHDARDANGDYPLQPAMLSQAPARFDPWRVPFVSQVERAKLHGYMESGAPRAFVVTTVGNWLWRSGKTIFEAIATAQKECKTQFPTAICVLYAVNDKVVMAQ